MYGMTSVFKLLSVLCLKLSISHVFENTSPRRYRSHEDFTSTVVGDFGRWQLKISVLMALLKLSNAWYQLNIIFMAPTQDFWCEKPKQFVFYSDQEWRKMCVPMVEEFPCLIFDPELLALVPHIDRALIPLVPCKKFVYDTSVFKRTITSDWNLVCDDHWKIHVTQFVMMWGILIGGIVFAMLADKFGRKKPLMIAIILQSATSYITCFLPTYNYFLAIWFLLACASGGITIISFVICMESVGGKWRMIMPILYQLPFGIGSAVMAAFAYWLRDWRKLEFALASLSAVYILYWFCIPESTRWLIAQGETEKAVVVLKAAAKENKLKWSSAEIRRLLPKVGPVGKAPGFLAFMKSKNMRLKTILLAINWFCTGLAFYTFSQYLGGIGGNVFLTVSVTGIISAPGPIVCVFVIMKFGRKTTIWIFQILTALCFAAILLVPKDTFVNDWPRLLIAGIGFAGMAASVPTLYLYTGELYPTLGRNVGVSGVTTFARIGSMVAPAIVILDTIMVDFPVMILTAISFAQIFLLVPLPETKGIILPDTIEEAERIAK